MSKNLERDFSLKDWVTKRAANAPEMQSADRMVDILPTPITIATAVKAIDKEELMRPSFQVESQVSEDTHSKERSKIDSVSQITARISTVAATPAASPTQQIQIVRLLRDLGDRLRQSEKEREILWRELDGCRKLLTDIEDKANRAEKAYLSIEHKISKAEPDNKEETKEFQNKVESKLSALETTAGSAILRLEDAVSENSKLSRRLDQITQDKVRMQRKMETLEETLVQTQDSLKSKALVLLTDAALANRTNLPQTPAYTAPAQAVINGQSEDQAMPWWKKTARSNPATNAVTASILIALGLAAGWGLSQMRDSKFDDLRQNLGLSWLSQDNAATEQSSSPADQTKLMGDIAKMANQVESGDPVATGAENSPAVANVAPQEDAELNTPVEAESVQALPSAVSNENAETMAVNAEKKAIESFNGEKLKGDLKDRIEPDKTLPSIVTQIETKAFSDDAEAQHDLAAIYTAGHAGVKTDYDRALKWFTESAHNGVANAQYNLGVLYHQGLGVKQDTAKAISLYRVAAANNHPEAQYNLGIAHMEGVGADYNPQVAAYYFERASAGGVVEAAYNLGLIQENGLLGESQPDEAVFWYKLAADHGNKQAKQALDQMAKQLGMKDEDVKRIFGRISAQRPDALKIVSASDKKPVPDVKSAN